MHIWDYSYFFLPLDSSLCFIQPGISHDSLHEVKWREVAQSCPTLCDSVDVACQAPPSKGFSRQEYWSGLPFPFPGDLPNPGMEPGPPALEADALTSEPPGKIIDTRDANKAAEATKSVLVAQLCPTLCDPMDCSPQGSSVHGILQARILEWVAMPFSKGSYWPRDQTLAIKAPRNNTNTDQWFSTLASH